MPPPVTPGGLPTYNATFTVAGVAYGFDVQTNGYRRPVQADLQITHIPWGTTIVVQGIGNVPSERTYQAVVYSEADLQSLISQVTQIGTLITTREPTPGVGAVLMAVEAGDTDPTSPTGWVKTQLAFTVTGPPV